MHVESSNGVLQEHYNFLPSKAMLFGGAVVGAATAVSAHLNLVEIHSNSAIAITITAIAMGLFSHYVAKKIFATPPKINNYFSTWPGPIPVANLHNSSPRKATFLQDLVVPRRKCSQESKMFDSVSPRRKQSQEQKILDSLSPRRKYSRESISLKFPLANDDDIKEAEVKLSELKVSALKRVDIEVTKYKKLMAEQVQKLTQMFENTYARIELNRKTEKYTHWFSDDEYYLSVEGQSISVNAEMENCDNLQQLQKNIDEYVFSIFTAVKRYVDDYANTSFSQINSKVKDALIWINNLEKPDELKKISESQIEAPVINICWEGVKPYVDNVSDPISHKIFTLFQQK